MQDRIQRDGEKQRWKFQQSFRLFLLLLAVGYSVFSFQLTTNLRVIKLRRMIWAGHVASVGERGGVYRVLMEKPEGKRPLGIPRHRWEDNIKM